MLMLERSSKCFGRCHKTRFIRAYFPQCRHRRRIRSKTIRVAAKRRLDPLQEELRKYGRVKLSKQYRILKIGADHMEYHPVDAQVVALRVT
ncbi:hypothetical protein GHA01_23160 [Novacetimonas hansenii]|uniref:Type II toxin-antitoxin system RelE/ParE family toxin n=1 Tax=Novacetimonas hansenii TaxID=436 RepID=A0ABQ0SH63_NOVHA|nr:hypothetical protein Gaha_0321_020 [Novacetimonas hansenii JCM 7643]GEC64467.1 hypothetical protein GHA01_23160 [Novacetimonas hansenii]